ncbi:MAG: aldehyde dehydrogenase family protein [Nanoarchaeota archaeon]|nr:aldehyde dehydrogenase family protein [Nanoarchaeota archaeon]
MKYKNYIGGRWISPSNNKYFESYSPHNNKSLGQFPKSSEKDVEKAISVAKEAYTKWKDVPAPKRGEILLEIANILKQEKKRLGKIITNEMGKVTSEAEGDVQEAIDIAEYMAGEGRRLFGHTTPSELKDKFCMTVRMPLGVVGVITPWNFPIAIPAWKIMPALICGNSVVFKPSSDTPLCAIEFVKILEKVGVPKGVVNLVMGSGKEIGDVILKSKDVRGISFTGSKQTGEYIVANAGLKKIGLELGGKNAIIVMDDAKIDLAVDGIIWGAFGTTGQRCTACSRVIVHDKVKRKLEKALLKRIKKLKLGYGINSTTDVGPLVNKQAVEKVSEYVEIGKKEGAKLVCGGKSLKMAGNFFEVTMFTNVKPSMRIANEEIFGPVLSLISVNSLKEAIKVANGVEYGLSSSIYTEDIKNAFIAMREIEAGITYVNSSTIGSEVHLPFGGMKSTGNGTREAGIEGINEFSEIKTLYVDYSGSLQKAQGIKWG